MLPRKLIYLACEKSLSIHDFHFFIQPRTSECLIKYWVDIEESLQKFFESWYKMQKHIMENGKRFLAGDMSKIIIIELSMGCCSHKNFDVSGVVFYSSIHSHSLHFLRFLSLGILPILVLVFVRLTVSQAHHIQ